MSNYLKLCKYAGSKSKYLDVLLPLIDQKKKFIEPFVGSGSVLLNVKNEFKLANDLNPYIIDMFSGFMDASYKDYLQFYSDCPAPYVKLNKESYYAFRDYFNKHYSELSLIEKAFYQVTLIDACINSMPRWSKTGFNQGYGSRGYNLFNEYEFNSIKKSLENTEVLNKTFFDLVHLDSSDTVWFLDPPYFSNPLDSYVKGFDSDDISKFIETIKSFNGDVIYTDTLNIHNKELLSVPGWNHMRLDKMNSLSKNRVTNENTMYEFVFFNFNYTKPQQPSLDQFYE